MARRPFFKAASSLAAILILAAGCGEPIPTAVQVESPTLSGSSAPKGPKANVVKTQHRAGTYAAVIGPQGGRIDFGIGSIDFPAGALAHATRITATTDGENLGVTFAPHGLQFPAERQPELRLTANAHHVDVADLRVVYVDTAGRVLEDIPSSLNIAAQQRVAGLQHFSTYWMAAP